MLTRTTRRHVFADLQPYVCLSEDCTATEKCFSRRHEWILHEIENHWKYYVCPYSCSETFKSRSKCIEHVHRSHRAATPAHQLEAVINLSSRPIRLKDGMPCPICQERLESVKMYQHHVGRHQEQLAIFALPTTQCQDNEEDDEEDVDDDESNLSESDGETASDSSGTADGEVRVRVTGENLTEAERDVGSSQPESRPKADSDFDMSPADIEELIAPKETDVPRGFGYWGM